MKIDKSHHPIVKNSITQLLLTTGEDGIQSNRIAKSIKIPNRHTGLCLGTVANILRELRREGIAVRVSTKPNVWKHSVYVNEGLHDEKNNTNS
jgi:dTDP-4-amino-4,6-dideoxygalactose transaminase